MTDPIIITTSLGGTDLSTLKLVNGLVFFLWFRFFKSQEFFSFLSEVKFLWMEMDLKSLARAQGKMGQKYQKKAKWPKTTFRGPILVPQVFFVCFGG